jgi:uncharacterized protein YaaR (DUF327 family)
MSRINHYLKKFKNIINIYLGKTLTKNCSLKLENIMNIITRERKRKKIKGLNN